MRAIENEIAAKRARRQSDRDKHRLVRTLSFSFLSLVILGTVIAFFLFFSHASEMREQRPASPAKASPPQRR